MEATPTLYDDHRLYIDFTFFEQNAKGNRSPLPQTFGFQDTVYGKGDVSGQGGGFGTVKYRGASYALIVNATAWPEK